MISKEILHVFYIKEEFNETNFRELERDVNSLIMKGERNIVVDLTKTDELVPFVLHNISILSNRAKKNLANFTILVEENSLIDKKMIHYKINKNVPYFYHFDDIREYLKGRQQTGVQYFTMEMAFTGEYDNLPRVREFILSVLHNLPLSEDDNNLIVLSIDEAVANIIKYAYQGSKEKHLIVQAQYKEPKLRFVLIDNGDHFDPTEKDVEGMNMEDYIKEGHHGGLGIFIIEKVMDSFQHLFIPGMGNRLIMEKVINKDENSNSR